MEKQCLDTNGALQKALQSGEKARQMLDQLVACERSVHSDVPHALAEEGMHEKQHEVYGSSMSPLSLRPQGGAWA